MPAFAFNIYPKGFKKQIPPQDTYTIGRTIVEQFRVLIQQSGFSGLIGQEEGFSILLYDGDRVKIEIETSTNIELDRFTQVLESFEQSGLICCWRPCDPDKNIRDIQLKLLATNLREAIPNADPFALSDSDWVKLSRAIMRMDFSVNSAYQRINQILQYWREILQNWCPAGIPLPLRYELLHLTLNPLGYDFEGKVLQQIG